MNSDRRPAASPAKAPPTLRTVPHAWPRGRLPNGRAVVGGLLVTIALLGLATVARGRNTAPPRYLVARQDVAIGTVLTPEHVRLVPIDLPSSLAQRALRRTELAVGHAAVAPLAEGDLVQRSDLVAAADHGQPVEVSIAVPRSQALDGRLVPGESVTVLGTFGTGDSANTRTVVADARIVEISSAESGLGERGELVLTLAVATTAEGVAVSHAGQAAEVTIIKTPPPEPEPETTGDDGDRSSDRRTDGSRAPDADLTQGNPSSGGG